MKETLQCLMALKTAPGGNAGTAGTLNGVKRLKRTMMRTYKPFAASLEATRSLDQEVAKGMGAMMYENGSKGRYFKD